MGCWFVELRLDYDDLIFTVYLTSSYFGTPEETSSALSLGLTIAGFLIAILAPVTGQRNDKSGRGIFWLGVNTLLLVASMAACFFVAPTPAVPVAWCDPDFCGERVQRVRVREL